MRDIAKIIEDDKKGKQLSQTERQIFLRMYDKEQPIIEADTERENNEHER